MRWAQCDKDPSAACLHGACSRRIHHWDISNGNSDGRWACGVSEKFRRGSELTAAVRARTRRPLSPQASAPPDPA